MNALLPPRRDGDVCWMPKQHICGHTKGTSDGWPGTEGVLPLQRKGCGCGMWEPFLRMQGKAAMGAVRERVVVKMGPLHRTVLQALRQALRMRVLVETRRVDWVPVRALEGGIWCRLCVLFFTIWRGLSIFGGTMPQERRALCAPVDVHEVLWVSSQQ